MSSVTSSRRRLPAVQTMDATGRKGLTLVWDPWAETMRAFIPPTDGVPWQGSFRSLSGTDRFGPERRIFREHLVGEAFDPIPVETCPLEEPSAFRVLPALRHAPFLEAGVFGQRPDIACSLALGARAIRAAVAEALVDGVTGDDGVIRAQVGESETAVDPRTGAWEILAADGHIASGTTLRGFALGLGGVDDGVFAVRLLEAVFGWRLPIRVALAIADAIDGAPEPRRVAE